MIFVDAGVFYARFAERDRHHEAADRFFAGLLTSPVPLVTTTAVLYETHALMLRISRVEPREDLRRLRSASSRSCGLALRALSTLRRTITGAASTSSSATPTKATRCATQSASS